MSSILQLIYTFNGIPIKISIFGGNWQAESKLYMENQKTKHINDSCEK